MQRFDMLTFKTYSTHLSNSFTRNDINIGPTYSADCNYATNHKQNPIMSLVLTCALPRLVIVVLPEVTGDAAAFDGAWLN